MTAFLPTFWKKTVRLSDAEFNDESLGTNLKSQKLKTKKLVYPFLLVVFHFETNLIKLKFLIFLGQFWKILLSLRIQSKIRENTDQKKSEYGHL